jgi:hypothetical protein
MFRCPETRRRGREEGRKSFFSARLDRPSSVRMLRPELDRRRDEETFSGPSRSAVERAHVSLPRNSTQRKGGREEEHFFGPSRSAVERRRSAMATGRHSTRSTFDRVHDGVAKRQQALLSSLPLRRVSEDERRRNYRRRERRERRRPRRSASRSDSASSFGRRGRERRRPASRGESTLR